MRVGFVEGEDAVHAVERDHHLAGGCHRAAGESRASTGRHECQAALVGEAGEGGNFLHGLRKHDRRRCHLIAARPVASPRCEVVCPCPHTVGGENLSQGIGNGHGWGTACGWR